MKQRSTKKKRRDGATHILNSVLKWWTRTDREASVFISAPMTVPSHSSGRAYYLNLIIDFKKVLLQLLLLLRTTTTTTTNSIFHYSAYGIYFTTHTYRNPNICWYNIYKNNEKLFIIRWKKKKKSRKWRMRYDLCQQAAVFVAAAAPTVQTRQPSWQEHAGYPTHTRQPKGQHPERPSFRKFIYWCG